jgi:hypothetical protein
MSECVCYSSVYWPCWRILLFLFVMMGMVSLNVICMELIELGCLVCKKFATIQTIMIDSEFYTNNIYGGVFMKKGIAEQILPLL